MGERIRDAQVAQEIAAQAGTEATPELRLNDFLVPIIFGPQRPPLASSGYFPGCAGIFVAAVAANTSMGGLAVDGTNASTIVRINSITIKNDNADQLSYGVRRVDDPSAFTQVAIPTGYIDAGSTRTGSVLHATKSDTVGPIGDSFGDVNLEPDETQHFPGPWILNQGALIVTLGAVNRSLRVWMNYEHWTAIRRQPPG